MKIPQLILKRLYTFGSIENVRGGVRFAIKNRLSDATLTAIRKVAIDGDDVPLDKVVFELGGDEKETVKASEIGNGHSVPFPLSKAVWIRAASPKLDSGKHEIRLAFAADPFGELAFSVKDAIVDRKDQRPVIPYDKEDDLGRRILKKRQRFVEKHSHASSLKHIFKYSIDPRSTRGNIENFTGVAQVPIGFAGPLLVHGEHADGEFLIPLATTEGTLVASYNRGIKVLNLSGGVTCTVSDDCMQRAPVFVFENARGARDFRDWVKAHHDQIAEAAEATSSIAKLLYVDTFLAHRFTFLRFNFATGDAAGQNMVGRATFAACSWILEQRDDVERFYLESNLATDKKGSQVNTMRTRGKRVTAEATIPREVLIQHMRVEPESLTRHAGIANVGAMLSGANNNGLHSPNAITAMFIATGQTSPTSPSRPPG